MFKIEFDFMFKLSHLYDTKTNNNDISHIDIFKENNYNILNKSDMIYDEINQTTAVLLNENPNTSQLSSLTMKENEHKKEHNKKLEISQEIGNEFSNKVLKNKIEEKVENSKDNKFEVTNKLIFVDDLEKNKNEKIESDLNTLKLSDSECKETNFTKNTEKNLNNNLNNKLKLTYSDFLEKDKENIISINLISENISCNKIENSLIDLEKEKINKLNNYNENNLNQDPNISDTNFELKNSNRNEIDLKNNIIILQEIKLNNENNNVCLYDINNSTNEIINNNSEKENKSSQNITNTEIITQDEANKNLFENNSLLNIKAKNKIENLLLNNSKIETINNIDLNDKDENLKNLKNISNNNSSLNMTLSQSKLLNLLIYQ